MLIVRAFLRDLVLLWPPAPRITLRIIGSTALFLQTDYERGTQDSDVLETRDIDAAAKKRLLPIGGKGRRPRWSSRRGWRTAAERGAFTDPTAPRRPR